MSGSMYTLLPEVLLNLSKISATVHTAIPVLEFLTLFQNEKVLTGSSFSLYSPSPFPTPTPSSSTTSPSPWPTMSSSCGSSSADEATGRSGSSFAGQSQPEQSVSPWFWCTTASSCMSLSLGTTWELVAGTTHSRQNALDYMTWTFFFRRLAQNPSYYGMEDTEVDRLNSFLSGVVGKAPDQL